jgi:molybdenum cofactor cytidylyltransferase
MASFACFLNDHCACVEQQIPRVARDDIGRPPDQQIPGFARDDTRERMPGQCHPERSQGSAVVLTAMRLTGILLAAGRGARFGGAKLLTSLPVASHGVSAGTAIGVASCLHMLSALPEVVAVVRPGDSLLAGQLRGAGARVVECARADEGMGASLACGVAAAATAEGWIVALADMPWIEPATIAVVADALGKGADIVATSHLGVRAHPVGFAQRHYAALAGLSGDEGAKSILASNRGQMQLIEVEDSGVVRDVDTRADLRT